MEKNLEDIFTKDILRRVKRAHFYRTHLRPVALEISFLGALVGLSAFFISLRSVFSNAYSAHSFAALMRFALIAFLHTSLSVKSISFAALLILLLVLRDVSFGLRRILKTPLLGVFKQF